MSERATLVIATPTQTTTTTTTLKCSTIEYTADNARDKLYAAQCLQQPKVHLTDDRLNERFAQLANAIGLLWLLLLQSAAINAPEGSLLDELLAAYRARLDGAPTKLVLGVDGSHAIAAVAGAGRSAVRQHGSGRIGAITARRRQTVHLQCLKR